MKNRHNTIISSLVIGIFLSAALTAGAGEPTKTVGVATVDLNTATAAELEQLPGIGPSKAQAIVDHRTRRPFKKIEDIMRVKGIGRKTFKKLSPYLSVGSKKRAEK